jgi:hypothetical protein
MMADAGDMQREFASKEEIKGQLALLKPKAYRCATLAFRIAAGGVKDLKTDSRTAANLEKAGEMIVWLELLAFSVYLLDRAAMSALKDSRDMYKELLINFVIDGFPEEAEKYGRKGLRSEKGWQDDIVGTLSTRCLQYFSLEQGVKGGAGSVESLPPDALFTEFGGVIAHYMGVPEDKAVMELASLRARTGFAEIAKEFGPAAAEPA